jgi:hypothetical protein
VSNRAVCAGLVSIARSKPSAFHVESFLYEVFSSVASRKLQAMDCFRLELKSASFIAMREAFRSASVAGSPIGFQWGI